MSRPYGTAIKKPTPIDGNSIGLVHVWSNGQWVDCHINFLQHQTHNIYWKRKGL